MWRIIAIIFMIRLIPGESKAQVVLLSESDTIQIGQKNMDSLAVFQYAQNWLISSVSEGFIYASIDSIYRNSKNQWNINAFRGSKENPGPATLVSEIDTLHLKKGNFQSINRYLTALNNTGYPFARIKLLEIVRDEGKINSNWKLEKGPFISFDTLRLFPENIPVQVSFLQNALGVKMGNPFSESAYRKVPLKMERIPFLQLKSDPDISFQAERATVYLLSEYVKSNTFEGVVGLLLDQEGSTLTGYINLDLVNLFKSGKSLQLEWQRFDTESQQVSLNYRHPYFLGSGLGTYGSLNLVKQDSIFLNRNFTAGLFINILNMTDLSFGYQFSGSQVTGEEGNITPFRTSWYELDLETPVSASALSDDFLGVKVSSAFGGRTLQNIPDSVDSKSNSFRLSAMIKGQKRLRNNLALYSSINLFYLYNRILYQNELNRLGGFKSFRGFNENEFFTSAYVFEQVELRYFFENSSYLFGLYDIGYLEAPLGSGYHSMGFGISLNNTYGQFSIIFATGAKFDDSFTVDNTKVHFGYTSKF